MARIKMGLYGDSFVEVWSEEKKKQKDEEHCSLETWPNIVAKKFELDIVHSGKGGSSYWDIPLQQFSFSNVPDILIFCWTSSGRIYNKDGVHINYDSNKIWHQNEKVSEEHKKASEYYFKHIHDEDKELAEYKACLYWFDQTILSQIPSDRKIIHLWSFGHDKQDNKLSGKYHPNNLTYLHNWKHGCEIRPSCMSIALMDGANFDDVDPFENHFNTQTKHNLMADFVMHSLIDTNVDGGYHREALNDYSDNVVKNHLYTTMPPSK